MSAFDVEHTFWSGYNTALKHRAGKGWSELITGPGIFEFCFVCNDCGCALPSGFVVAPRYCCYCGKDHEYNVRSEK